MAKTFRDLHVDCRSAGLCAVLCVLLAIVATGCASNSSTVESRLGAAQANTFLLAVKPALLRDDQIDGYVGEIASRLSTAARQQDPSRGKSLTVVVVAAPILNCTTLGEGYVYISSGLFVQCRNDEELAAAVAHAYGHIVAGHRASGRAMAPAASPTPTSTEQPAATADDIVLLEAANPFTPAQEDEADRLGYMIYARAGWNPNHYSALTTRLAEAGFDGNSTDATRTQSRAGVASRIRLPAAARDWRKPPVADEPTFNDYKKLIARLAAAPPAGAAEDRRHAERLFVALPNCVLNADQPAQIAARADLQAARATQQPPSRGGVKRGTDVPVVAGEGSSGPQRR